VSAPIPRRKRPPRKTPTGLSAEDTIKGKLQRAAKKCLDQHEADDMLPTNDRFVMYELEHEGVVSKEQRPVQEGCRMARRPSQDLGEAILHLRDIGPDNGGIPWWWIEDETRSVTHVRTARTIAEYIDASVDRASLDRWDGKPPPLALCESRSLAGVLKATADDYTCWISSTNGQVRGFLVTDVAPILQPGQKVLYFGDLDLSAGHIEAHTHAVLRKHAPLWAASEMQLDHRIRKAARRGHETDLKPLWERVCITAEQVEVIEADRAERGLGPATIRKVDRRYIDPLTGEKGVEVDAGETEGLGQAFIVNALKARLDELMPEPLADIKARQNEQKTEMRKLLAAARKRQRNRNGQ